jgi:hypothetical protein
MLAESAEAAQGHGMLSLATTSTVTAAAISSAVTAAGIAVGAVSG